jgi:hypothetical protein
MTNPEKIAFCITCMNRLNHLQQTLEKNIRDNYLAGKVEFVLLDYNSQDGLGEWVLSNMKKYMDEGILSYYKTIEPAHYLRSHSRNMAFRLASDDATVLCNLDADNFLGKGFAAFMLQEFSEYNNIFYVNNYSFNDTYGRVCVQSGDFMLIRGYNEALKGYGYEDNDLKNRLVLHGLNPKSFHDPEFYHCVLHTDEDRISEEFIFKNIFQMYITYINPYTSGIFLLYRDFTLEQYTLTDNFHLNIHTNSLNKNDFFQEKNRRTVIQEDNMLNGIWRENYDGICVQFNNIEYDIKKGTSSVKIHGHDYYKIQDDELRTQIIISISDAVNYNEACRQIEENMVINPDGFGKGTVYKNFDFSKPIVLS